MINPYKVLGVSENATQDEIKSAYRKLAKQYHPDLHPNDPNAVKKMNELNEAYDMLQNPKKYEQKRAQEQQRQQQQNAYRNYTGYGSSGYGSSSSSGYGGSSSGYSGSSSNGGWYSDFGGFGGFNFNDIFGQQYDTAPRAKSTDSATVIRSINAINGRRYAEAISLLSSVPSSGRDARWYYICSYAYYGSGDTARAMDLIKKAVEMDPGNRMYQQLYNTYANNARSSSYTRSSGSSYAGFSPLKAILRIVFFIFLLRIFTIFFGGGCAYIPFSF